MYGYYFDPTYFLLVIGMLLSLAASARVKSTFAIYSRVRSASGLTGAEAARRILHMAGITDVTVVPISGSLTDHYDPRNKRLALSQDVYDRTSVAVIGFNIGDVTCPNLVRMGRNYSLNQVWVFAFLSYTKPRIVSLQRLFAENGSK